MQEENIWEGIDAHFEWVLLAESGKCPQRQHSGDAGYDLYVSRSVTIPPHKFVDIHTDVAVRFPPGIWGRIAGRSSTLRRRNLLVAEGIIDNGYTGELFIGIYNMSDETIVVRQGERLAQLIPHAIVNVTWKQVEELEKTSRGNSGFGSTGG